MQALIFDVDGTLADTERDGHRVAFNQAFAQAGLDWHWSAEIYGDLLSVTGGKERMAYYVEKYDRPQRSRADLAELIKRLHARKTENYVALLANNAIPLRPGVERLLREAREAGLRLAIATTTTPQNVTSLLESALGNDSVDWFEVIGAGDIVANKKPACDIYDYVLDKLQLPADRCMAFEDSHNGIRSSLGAGLKTIITYNGYTRNDDFSGAALVLDHFGDADNPSTVMQREYQRDYLDIELVSRLAS